MEETNGFGFHGAQGQREMQGSPAKPKSKLLMMKNRLRQQRQKKDAAAAAAGAVATSEEEDPATWDQRGQRPVNGTPEKQPPGHGQSRQEPRKSGLRFSKNRSKERSKTAEIKLSNDMLEDKKVKSGLFKSKSVEMKLKGSSPKSKEQHSSKSKPLSSESEGDTCNYNVPNGRVEKVIHKEPLRITKYKRIPEVKVTEPSPEIRIIPALDTRRGPDSKMGKAPVMRIPSTGRSRESKLAQPPSAGQRGIYVQDHRNGHAGRAPMLQRHIGQSYQSSQRRGQSQDALHSLRQHTQQGVPRQSNSALSQDHNSTSKVIVHVPQRERVDSRSDCDQEYSSSPRTDETFVIQSKGTSEPQSPSLSVHGYSVGWVRRHDPVRSSSMEPDPRYRPLSKEEYKQRRRSRSLDNLVQESEELSRLTKDAKLTEHAREVRRPSADSQSSVDFTPGYFQVQRPTDNKPSAMRHSRSDEVVYGSGLDGGRRYQSNTAAGLAKIPETDVATLSRSSGKTSSASNQTRPSGLRVTNPADLGSKPPPPNRAPNGHHPEVVMRAKTAPTPRRHTVNVGGSVDYEMGSLRKDQEFKRQKVAFLEHLADKYPAHARVITGHESPGLNNNKSGGEVVRRKTTQVTYNPDQNQSFVYDSDDVMSVQSEANTSPTGQFRRGGRLRASLPVVRSPNKSMDKPMGLVFLILRNETKRALLPNEITSIDTVRALFVRSFPEQLSMPWFDVPGRKVYIMDPATNVYYELEDLRDIKDRTVLKIYEKDPGDSQSPALSPMTAPRPVNYHPPLAGYESDTSTRSAPPAPGAAPSSAPRSPTVHRPIPHRPYSHAQDLSSKTQSLPAQANYVYQQQMQQFGQQHSHSGGYSSHPNTPPSQHWSPGHRPHPHPQFGSNQSSPQRSLPPQQVGPQRHSVAYLPEQPGSTAAGYQQNGSLPQSRSYQDYQQGAGSSRSGSTTPTQDGLGSRSRIDKMEAQLANLTAWVQTAVMQPGGSRPGSARSNSSIVSDASYSAKSNRDLDRYIPIPDHNLLENTSSESSTTVTPMQSPTSGSQPGMFAGCGSAFYPCPFNHMHHLCMSDISSTTPQAMVSVELQSSLRRLQQQARELRLDCNKLRRMQLGNSEGMRDTIQETFQKIRDAVNRVPGANEITLRTERTHITNIAQSYKSSAAKVDKDLADLEASVEELRGDVLNKRCRVNMGEVETMALALSNVSKSLADLKARFPTLQDGLKTVMAGEMEVVITEEKFLKEEPDRIETALKRCKKLTQTLYTMKRLASVQEQRPPSVPSLPTNQEALDQDRKQLLENIQAMVPNHEARVQSLQVADEQRERKKKLTTSGDALRFEKTLEMAQKQLKETNHLQENEQRAEKVLSTLYQQKGAASSASDAARVKPSAETRLGSDSVDGVEVEVVRVSARATENDAKELAASGSPPLKPPRTMVYDTPPAENSNTEAVIVKSPILVAPSTAVMSPTSTFTSSSSQAASGSSSKIPSMTGRPPVPLPSATSTPKPGGHVTFSTMITEIKDASPTGSAKPKRIPPPPPPRKSSRATVKKHSPTTPSPTGNALPPSGNTRTPSPHTYENIHNFAHKEEPAKANKVGPPTGAKSSRPMSKFQKDIAEGICANMNRPDLQEQRVNCANVVKEANLSDSGKDRSSDSENSSIDSQKNATVKRNPKATSATNGVNGDSGGKKVPPPPPVRKTSTLSSSKTGDQRTDSLPRGSHKTELSAPQQKKLNKALTNGDIVKHQPVNGSGPQNGPHTTGIPKAIKKFEETEIY